MASGTSSSAVRVHSHATVQTTVAAGGETRSSRSMSTEPCGSGSERGRPSSESCSASSETRGTGAESWRAWNKSRTSAGVPRRSANSRCPEARCSETAVDPGTWMQSRGRS